MLELKLKKPILSSTADPENNSHVLALDFNTREIVSLDPSKYTNFEIVYIVTERGSSTEFL